MGKRTSNKPGERRVTAVEVARRAGVSQSTVSRVFSAPNAVADATTLRVLEASEQLGYNPNALASSLITRRTNMIGLVMAEITSPFYPYVLEKFTQRLHELDRRVLLFSTGPNKEVDDVLPDVLRYQVDGVIIANVTLTSKIVDACVRRGTALLLFNRYMPDTRANAVCCDNLNGGRMVADVLLDAGHTRLAYIAGKQNTSTNLDRERGFGERLRQRGHTVWLRAQGHYTYESGYAAALELLQRSDPPDAIFCANDIMALGALDAAHDQGVAVPGQCSIVGFDDIPAAAWASYALTTMRQPVDTMIDASVQLLLERIEQPSLPPVTTFLPGQLVRRSSARLLHESTQ
jgi:DNA-binding LacI/PurR family transcriptional regulator